MAIKVNGYGYLTGSVYGVSFQGATLPTGAGMSVGDCIVVNNANGLETTNIVDLVQFNTSSAQSACLANGALKLVNSGANATPFVVDATAAATDVLHYVNDNSGAVGSQTFGGASVAKGNYFYATRASGGAQVNVLVATGNNANAALIATTSAFVLGAFANTNAYTPTVLLATNSSGSNAARACICS